MKRPHIPLNPQDLARLEEMTSNGRRCNSLCCTGGVIAETMLAVVANEDVRRLDFNVHPRKARQNAWWAKQRIAKKYVHFAAPAVIAHYTECVRNCAQFADWLMREEGDEADKPTVKLERLVVEDTDIPTRQMATKRSVYDVLTSYNELVGYLEVPGMLSENAGGQQFGAFSEHLILSLGELFSFGHWFPRLTEIVLGREACNTR